MRKQIHLSWFTLDPLNGFIYLALVIDYFRYKMNWKKYLKNTLISMERVIFCLKIPRHILQRQTRKHDRIEVSLSNALRFLMKQSDLTCTS